MNIKLLNKIDCSNIFRNHFKTLVNYNTGRATDDDWFTFFWVPFLIAIILILISGESSLSTVNLIITALSIFIGLLINVLVLIFSVIDKETEQSVKLFVLKETLANISYSIVVSVITIGCCILVFINNYIVQYIGTFIIYFSVAHIFITLLMIVKRMYSLFNNELDEFAKKYKVEQMKEIKSGH